MNVLLLISEPTPFCPSTFERWHPTSNENKALKSPVKSLYILFMLLYCFLQHNGVQYPVRLKPITQKLQHLSTFSKYLRPYRSSGSSSSSGLEQLSSISLNKDMKRIRAHYPSYSHLIVQWIPGFFWSNQQKT